MGSDATKVFDEGGGIGRLLGNDWVLPDPDCIVSKHHASVSESGGVYVLKDLKSTNGTVVNGVKLPKGGKIQLNNGDEIDIGEYRLSVSIDTGVPAQPSPLMDGRPPEGAISEPLLRERTRDVLDLLDPAPKPPPEPAPIPDTPAENAFVSLPEAAQDPNPPKQSQKTNAPSQEDLDDIWNVQPSPSASTPAEPVQTPPEPPLPPQTTETTSESPEIHSSATPSTDSHDLAALFIGAGIDPAHLNARAIESLGKVLRIVVEGMVEVLRARADIKDEFRVSMTRLKATDNNPLKLATTTDDALNKLFVNVDSSYQDPVKAFQEGFDDIKNHQMAMLVGMRAGFRAVMASFDPTKLEETFDKGLMRSSMLEVVNKTKYWNLYRKNYEDLGDEEQSFRYLFGDVFAEAYEAHMAILTAGRPRY